MRSKLFLMTSLAALSSLSLASGCATKASTQLAYPSAADLAVEAKPQVTVEVLLSAQAAAKHNAAVEAWGERGWLSVARICTWAKDMGMPGAPCERRKRDT